MEHNCQVCGRATDTGGNRVCGCSYGMPDEKDKQILALSLSVKSLGEQLAEATRKGENLCWKYGELLMQMHEAKELLKQRLTYYVTKDTSMMPYTEKWIEDVRKFLEASK